VWTPLQVHCCCWLLLFAWQCGVMLLLRLVLLLG
jgi:hypothetical protein